MIPLNSQLLDKWKSEFKKESGFELLYAEEKVIALPCFSFDLTFKGLPNCTGLRNEPYILGELVLIFYLYGEPYLYCQGENLRAWELFSRCVLPFFSKRYGIRSHNFLMSSHSKKKPEGSPKLLTSYCELQLLRPFLLKGEQDN